MVKILGIDPGYDRVGVCVLDYENDKPKILYSTCLETDKKLALDKRIFQLIEELKTIIQKFQPTELSIEKLFFTKNQKTVMGVSEARGAIIYLCNSLGLNISEYTPLQIKIAITSYGKADKQQVYLMLKNLLKLKENFAKKLDDEYDAIAIAYTHAVSRKSYSQKF